MPVAEGARFFSPHPTVNVKDLKRVTEREKGRNGRKAKRVPPHEKKRGYFLQEAKRICSRKGSPKAATLQLLRYNVCIANS